jgi:transposase InsO family protein
MAEENRLWGAERIRGELLKLGVRVSKRTIQKYMPRARRNSSQKCLDHMLILHSYHLYRIVRAYADYYNHSRPHQGIGQRVPAQYPRNYPPLSGQIIATPVLVGLHHAYSRAAYLH